MNVISTELKQAWNFFKYELTALATITLVIAIPLEVISAIWVLATIEPSAILETLFTLGFIVAASLQSAAVIYYIASVVTGQPLSVQGSFSAAVQKLTPYVMLTIIMVVLIFFGFLLFIVPGIYLACRLSFAPFILLIHNTDPFTALSSSWEQTDGYLMLLFVGLVQITLVLYTPFIAFHALLGDNVWLLYSFGSLANLALSIGASMYSVFAYRVYDQVNRSNATQ